MIAETLTSYSYTSIMCGSIYLILMLFLVTWALCAGISVGLGTAEHSRLIERRNLEKEILKLRREQSKLS